MAEARDVATEDIRVEVDYGEVPRRFVSLGTGNFLFSLFAAYRTGPKSFAVLGLGPRLMHRFWSKPGFECFWDSNGASSSKVSVCHPSFISPAWINISQGNRKPIENCKMFSESTWRHKNVQTLEILILNEKF